MLVLIFDTETTGLPQTKIINPDTLKQWPYIVQFSYIIYDTEKHVFASYKDNIINIPEHIIIPTASSNIHGITNEICADCGKKIDDVLDEFFSYLPHIDMLVGHNITFDINMIKVELLRLIYNVYDKIYTSKSDSVIQKYKYYLYTMTNYKNIYCTLQESVDLCNIKAIDKFGKSYTKFPKLIELHEKLFKTIPNNLHNSFNDILVTLRCFMKLKYDLDIMDYCNEFKLFSKNIY